MYPLNNAATANAYSDAATFTPPPTSSVTVQINNASVDYQIMTRKNGVLQAQTVDRILLPGAWVFRAGTDWPPDELLVSLAFKSHATGTPAQVSAS